MTELIDVILINPYVYAPKTKLPPIGLLSIASILDINGYNVKIIDMQIDTIKKVEDTLNNMKDNGIVGFGGATEGRRYVFKMSKIAKDIRPNCTVLYGGPHASFTAELTLSCIKTIDIIVISEGEITVLELVKCILKKHGSIDQIKGIVYRKNRKIIATPIRPRIKDLDILVYNNEKFVDLKEYDQNLLFSTGKAMHFITSRGCFANCVFCSASALWRHKITAHSPKRVVKEVEEMLQKRPDISGFLFSDSTFTYSKKRVYEICKEIKNKKLDFLWSCSTRADTIDYEMLEWMKDAGCYCLDLGFESASQRVLDAIRKKTTVEKSIEIFNWIEKLDMKLILGVTWGHPTETYKEALHTLNFVKNYLSDNIHMTDPQPMRIYPGTELEHFAIENSLLPKDFDWCIDYDDDPGLNRSTPYVPVLIQHQMGISEFKSLESEFKKIKKGGSDAIFVK